MAHSLDVILSGLEPDEVLRPGTSQYDTDSSTWAVQKNAKPKVVARPKSVDSLTRLVAALKETSLEYAMRSGGYGNASAKDVLISMTAFDSFESEMTPGKETVTIGAGQSWGDVDTKIDKHCPGYATISPRCSFLGVGGPLVFGGLSWMSSERGMACAPGNLIDALIVTADGKAVWAAEEDPDLMWAIRGGGGSFGIVVKAKVRIWKYPDTVFTGRIFYPRSSLPIMAKEVAAFSSRVSNAKMALHLYGMNMEQEVIEGKRTDADGLVLMLYDANGEAHARSEEGFAWAFKIPGALSQMAELSFTTTNAIFDDLARSKGAVDSWMSAPLVKDITEDHILRAWKWFDELNEAYPKLKTTPLGAFVLIELLQKPAIHTEVPRADCAWPHTRAQHVFQLGVAAPPDDPKMAKGVVQALIDAPEILDPGHKAGDFLPNFVQEWNDPVAVYGPNYEKLRQIKQRVDPDGKLGGPFK